MDIAKKNILILIVLLITNSLFSQKQLIQYSFDSNMNPTSVDSSIGVGAFMVKVASSDLLIQKPTVITDGTVSSMFFRINANYDVSTNNTSFAIAPKAGNNIKITHIEFRVRFGSLNSGNGGIFITKDPTTTTNTQIWACGNNKTFNTYKDFVVSIPESAGLNYSESTTDSIRFVFGHGKNTQGMYFDNFVIYGIVNNETNLIQNISINALLTNKNLAKNPSGANSCWLMDSDIKWPRTVSNESRFAELKIGSLRFPYGHLGDNYLWHTPGFYSTVESTGPIPKVASLNSEPANWSWAVNPTDGTFLKDLSFDEYVGICKRNGIEPLIVVNAQSYKYTGGPSYEVLKTSALEWVRYANITKGYGIKYWQIGNEVEHDGNLSESEYINLFKDFSSAMKAVDSTIKVGTGVLSNTTWNKDVLTQAGSLCSFISTHNYQFNSTVAAGGFRTWYKDNSILATNVYNTQNMLNTYFANRPDIEILVTETNATGGDYPDVSSIDIYKALYWFEMDMNEIAQKNVKYTYLWGSHSPWGGQTDPGDLGSFLENSAANTVRPSGRIVQLVNTYLKDKLINVTRVTGNLRTYASISNDGNEMSIFILNKNLYTEKVNLQLLNFDTIGTQVEEITYKGSNFNDIAPVLTTNQISIMPTQMDLAPVSLTIFHLKKTANTNIQNVEKKIINLFYEKENIHTQYSDGGCAKLSIYSVDGRYIATKNIHKESETFNTYFLKRGVYIATLSTDSYVKSIKIFK